MFRYINVQWWCSSEHTSSTRPWQSDGPSLGVIPMFPSLHVLRSLCSPVLCSPVSMFPSLYAPRFYVPRSLCSPVLCSPVPMFPNPYVPQYLCSPIPMFPGTYLPRVFFWGGGGEEGMRSVGTICWQHLKIGYLFQDVRHCHLRRFILFIFRQKEVGNITFPITSCMKRYFWHQVFYPPPDEAGAVEAVLWRPVRPAVLLFGRLLVCTRFDSGEDLWMDFFNFARTHPLGGDGCRCAFRSLWNFNYLNGRPSAIISFNIPVTWPHFVSRADLGNPWVDPFHIAHTHPLGGVDVHFGVHKVWSTFADHRS